MLYYITSGKYSGRELIFVILVMLLALTLSFAFHEFMHAAAAVWLGDETPRNRGRLTLNPAAHVDPIGALCILIVGFGWGKPVVYNPNNLNRFKSKRLMNIIVSLAGVTGNLILAILSTIVYAIAEETVGAGVFANNGYNIWTTFFFIREFSMGLLAFNLLPIPPLDGFHVVEELLPLHVKYSNGWRTFVSVGQRVLLMIVIIGSVGRISILGFIMDYIRMPFDMLLGLIEQVIYGLM